MPPEAQAYRVEYGVIEVKKGKEPTIYAPSIDRITIHDVSEVGDELWFRYSVLWPERSDTVPQDAPTAHPRRRSTV